MITLGWVYGGICAAALAWVAFVWWWARRPDWREADVSTTERGPSVGTATPDDPSSPCPGARDVDTSDTGSKSRAAVGVLLQSALARQHGQTVLETSVSRCFRFSPTRGETGHSEGGSNA